MRFATIIVILAAGGCAAPGTGSDLGTFTKAEAEALGGKSDHVDLCDWMHWYGDGVCDRFCPLTDHAPTTSAPSAPTRPAA